MPDALAATPNLVIFLDTCERLAPLDSWLREAFLPQLPQQRADDGAQDATGRAGEGHAGNQGFAAKSNEQPG